MRSYPTIKDVYQALDMDDGADDANLIPEIFAVLFWTCTRCGYHWPKTKDVVPRTCASKECKSPYWNTPRKAH